jgi:hypothetical protein
MILILLAVAGLVLVWGSVSIVRLGIVHNHICHRIDEVYESEDWYKYPIDVDGTYNLALWDYRKWSYKQFFPEEVV